MSMQSANVHEAILIIKSIDLNQIEFNHPKNYTEASVLLACCINIKPAQQTIQIHSLFALHNFFYIIIYVCEHIQGFLQNFTSLCLQGALLQDLVKCIYRK